MAKVRTTLITRKEIDGIVKDYPELDSVFERINDFISAVGGILNAGILLQDNLTCNIQDITFQPEASGRTNFPMNVSIPFKAIVKAAIILKIDDISGGENYPVSQQRPFTLSWNASSSGVVINQAPGRDTGRTHRVKVLFLA